MLKFMSPTDRPTKREFLRSSSTALRIAKQINLREDAKRASQLLPKALRNFDEADALPATGCVIRELKADEDQWCELCGWTHAPDELLHKEKEIPLCATCAEKISQGVDV